MPAKWRLNDGAGRVYRCLNFRSTIIADNINFFPKMSVLEEEPENIDNQGLAIWAGGRRFEANT